MPTVALNPVQAGVTAHADLAGLLADDHANYAFLPGRPGGGGQQLIGGTFNFDPIILRGAATPDFGSVRLLSPLVSIYDFSSPLGLTDIMLWNPTIPASGGGVPSVLHISPTITVTAGLFIISAVRDTSLLTWTVAPGFAVSTLFFAQSVYRASTPAVPPAQAQIYAASPTMENFGAGAGITVSNHFGFTFTPIMRARTAGDSITVTNTGGLRVSPAWNTNSATASVNFGTVRGVHMLNPGPVLFGQSLGTETWDGAIGLEVDALPFVASAIKRALRSALTPAANTLMLENTGGALSDFGAGDAHWNDGAGVAFGNTVAAPDVRIGWDGVAGSLNFDPTVGEDLFFAFDVVSGKPSYLFEAETFGDSEVNYTQIRFGFDRYAFGQTGTIGNQVGLFVAGPRTVDVAGGWSDYLLTQGGNLDILALALSDVAAWTINQISLDTATGSITSLDTFVVGGMTTSNPGITVTERSALKVTGRSKLRGAVQYPPINPAALAAGNNNDWAGLLTGSPNNNTRRWARVTGNATTSVLTGIDATAVQDGDTFELTNVGAENILIENQGTGSLAANRIITGQGGSIAPNFVLKADRSTVLRYDGTSSRWRVLTPPGAVAPLSGHWRFDSTTTMADPGSGAFRNNNATLASVTSIAISDISFRGGDASAIIGALASGDQLYIQNETDAAEFMVFNITATTDNTTWWQIDGTAGDVGNAFTNNNEFNIIAIFA